jgi:hypothetical protein
VAGLVFSRRDVTTARRPHEPRASPGGRADSQCPVGQGGARLPAVGELAVASNSGTWRMTPSGSPR